MTTTTWTSSGARSRGAPSPDYSRAPSTRDGGSWRQGRPGRPGSVTRSPERSSSNCRRDEGVPLRLSAGGDPDPTRRSEEHTSELQSHSDLVCRLLLEKKKRRKILIITCVQMEA